MSKSDYIVMTMVVGEVKLASKTRLVQFFYIWKFYPISATICNKTSGADHKHGSTYPNLKTNAFAPTLQLLFSSDAHESRSQSPQAQNDLIIRESFAVDE